MFLCVRMLKSSGFGQYALKGQIATTRSALNGQSGLPGLWSTYQELRSTMYLMVLKRVASGPPISSLRLGSVTRVADMDSPG